MKRPRRVISKIRSRSESSKQDDNAIVPSFARIAELRGYFCIAMSSSLPWFVMIMPPMLFGSEGLTGDGKPQRVKMIEIALAYQTRVAAWRPSLSV